MLMDELDDLHHHLLSPHDDDDDLTRNDGGAFPASLPTGQDGLDLGSLQQDGRPQFDVDSILTASQLVQSLTPQQLQHLGLPSNDSTNTQYQHPQQHQSFHHPNDPYAQQPTTTTQVSFKRPFSSLQQDNDDHYIDSDLDLISDIDTLRHEAKRLRREVRDLHRQTAVDAASHLLAAAPSVSSSHDVPTRPPSYYASDLPPSGSSAQPDQNELFDGLPAAEDAMADEKEDDEEDSGSDDGDSKGKGEARATRSATKKAPAPKHKRDQATGKREQGLPKAALARAARAKMRQLMGISEDDHLPDPDVAAYDFHGEPFARPVWSDGIQKNKDNLAWVKKVATLVISDAFSAPAPSPPPPPKRSTLRDPLYAHLNLPTFFPQLPPPPTPEEEQDLVGGIPREDLDEGKVLKVVKVAFANFCKKYKAQTDEESKLNETKAATRRRRWNRKDKKQKKRANAAGDPTYQAHTYPNILLIDYMSSEYSSEGSYPSSSSFSSSSSDEHDDDDRESVSSSPAMTRRRRKGTKSGTDVSRRGKRLPEGLWEECRRKAMQEDGEEAMARALEMPDEDEGNDVSGASGKAKGKGKGKGKVKKAKMGKADRERKKKQAEAGQGNKEVKFLEVRTPRWRSGDLNAVYANLDRIAECQMKALTGNRYATVAHKRFKVTSLRDLPPPASSVEPWEYDLGWLTGEGGKEAKRARRRCGVEVGERGELIRAGGHEALVGEEGDGGEVVREGEGEGAEGDKAGKGSGIGNATGVEGQPLLLNAGETEE